MALAGIGTLFICGGIQGYQAFVGDLRKTGALEWPLRILLVIGGFVIATPGGGINPLSQWQITSLGVGDPCANHPVRAGADAASGRAAPFPPDAIAALNVP